MIRPVWADRPAAGRGDDSLPARDASRLRCRKPRVRELWRNPIETPNLDRAIQVLFEDVEVMTSAPQRLPESRQTLLAVHGAQGVIDNGGFQYFFESDWPGTPPYSFFSDAYRRIGADPLADALDRAVAMFPFSAPHRFRERRLQFLASLPEDHELFELGDAVCGDARVWEKLERYATDHMAELLSPTQRETDDRSEDGAGANSSRDSVSGQAGSSGDHPARGEEAWTGSNRERPLATRPRDRPRGENLRVGLSIPGAGDQEAATVGLTE